jgi:colicin import membrane protein
MSFSTLTLAASVLLCFAQVTAYAAMGDTLEAVDAERAKLQSESTSAEAACYERFAVNACLADVASKRRLRAAALRKREILIRDAQRAERAQDQMRVLEEKAVEQQKRQAEAERATPTAAQETKIAPLAQKPVIASDKSTPMSAEEAVANRATFDAKQSEAARHRAEVEKRLQEKKDRADSLPVSP